MLSNSSPRQFPARFTSLPELLATLGEACAAAAMTADARHRAEVVLEEALSNSIHHGYRGETDLPVWLATTILPDGLRLVFQDAAEAFDPLSTAALPEDARIGGVGRVLIKSLPRRADYALVDGRNTLILEFARET